MLSPCKDCPDRHPHCHSECEKYKAFDALCEQARKKRNLERQTEDAIQICVDRVRKRRRDKTKM